MKDWGFSFLEWRTRRTPRLVADTFNRATHNPLEKLLFSIRARAFDPRAIAKGIERLSVPPRGAVSCLDIGCNIGAKTDLVLAVLKNLGCSKVSLEGIDLSEEAVRLARELNSRPNVVYSVKDFLRMELPKAHYDYIFLSAVWHHFEDTKEALLRIEKCLKPKGVAVLMNGFYPENPVLRPFALLLQRFYRFVELRRGLRYNRPLVSDVRRQVAEHCGKDFFCRDFANNFPTNLFGTKTLVLGRKPRV